MQLEGSDCRLDYLVDVGREDVSEASLHKVGGEWGAEGGGEGQDVGDSSSERPYWACGCEGGIIVDDGAFGAILLVGEREGCSIGG